jgi:chromosome segregation ATPase
LTKEDNSDQELSALQEKVTNLEAEVAKKSQAEAAAKAQVTDLEKKIESMKRERSMIDQAMAMLKEKVASLSSQRGESPERGSQTRGHSTKTIPQQEDAGMKKKEEEFREKYSALEQKYEKLSKEKDLIVADIDRKVDQIISLKGECTKFRQSHNKAVKEKDKMKDLFQELNKNYIQQGVLLDEAR